MRKLKGKSDLCYFEGVILFKILLVTDYYPPVLGGISTQVEALAVALRNKGHSIYVHTVSGGPAKPVLNNCFSISRAPHLSSLFPFLFRNKTEKNMPPMPDPLFLRSLRSIIKHFKPDVIHAHGWVLFPVASLARKYPYIKTVGTLHDYGFICPKRDLINNFGTRKSILKCDYCTIDCGRLWVGQECLNCSQDSYGQIKSIGMVSCLHLFEMLPEKLNIITAVSNYVAEKARKKYSVPVKVVPNFLQVRRPEEVSYNDLESIPKTDILFVGRLSKQKGIFLLLDAFELLKKKLPQAKLTVVGKTDPYCHFEIRDSSISYFKNLSRENLLKLYQQAKVVVVPSAWADPQPMVVLEAMSFQKPLIVTNVGGLKEMVINGKTGLVVEPSAKEVAISLESLLNDLPSCVEMGLKGYMRLKEKYSPEVVVPQFEKIYTDF